MIIMILTENIKRLPISSLHISHFTRAFSTYIHVLDTLYFHTSRQNFMRWIQKSYKHSIEEKKSIIDSI